MAASGKPSVTVLMAAHNEEAYIGCAVGSLLRQTFDNFELIVIDDASTDNTAQCLRRFNDPRIRILRNEKRLGLTPSLVRGMKEARGTLVARLDADDVAMPKRLEKQVAALLNEPSLGLIGSNCFGINDDGRRIGSRYMPATDLAIRWRSLIDNPFVHSSIMFRIDAYEKAGGYDPAIMTAQDYDLWTRMLRFTKACNLSSKLVAYRVRQGAVTDQHRKLQLKNHDSFAHRTLTELMPAYFISRERYRLLRALYAGGPPAIAPTDIAPLVMAFWSLLQAFYEQHTTTPGWTHLTTHEWLRSARRLQHAPRCSTTYQAWKMICTPRFIRK